MSDKEKNYPEALPREASRIFLDDGRELIILGAAHVSKTSARLAAELVNDLAPDTVCLELDPQRYAALKDEDRFRKLNLREIIRKKQLATLLVNLVLASFQRRLGDRLGIRPGEEQLAAARAAEEKDIPINLCDRDVRITLKRAWRGTSWWKKSLLCASLFASLFSSEEISEEKIEQLKESDLLSEMMTELARDLPETKRILIDERDIFMAERIKAVGGKRIVAIVGAGHVPGLVGAIGHDNRGLMSELNRVPKGNATARVIGWSIPAAIVCALAAIGIKHGAESAADNIIYWIFANGIPAGIGAAISLGHPLTIIAGFAAAPLTSLTPVIGAGYVTAFIQALLVPPLVEELENVLADMARPRAWWSNRLLRILLVFILTSVGSLVGTWVGGVKIFHNLIA